MNNRINVQDHKICIGKHFLCYRIIMNWFIKIWIISVASTIVFFLLLWKERDINIYMWLHIQLDITDMDGLKFCCLRMTICIFRTSRSTLIHVYPKISASGIATENCKNGYPKIRKEIEWLITPKEFILFILKYVSLYPLHFLTTNLQKTWEHKIS